MENTSQQQNQVFNDLWLQSASGSSGGRRVDQAKNSHGQRALKFKTRSFHKALILETDQRPGFMVRICDFAEKPGLIDSKGILTFANPVETESLAALLIQIDRWALSFETIFGERGATIPTLPHHSQNEAIDDSQGAAITQQEVVEQGPESMRMIEAQVQEIPVDEWDQMDENSISNDKIESP